MATRALPVVRVYADSGEVLFNSWTDDVLFFQEERYITGSNSYNSNRQIVISYPNLAGRKILTFVTVVGHDIQGLCVPFSRITYPGGIPTVTLSLDNTRTDVAGADIILTVMLSGVSQ